MKKKQSGWVALLREPELADARVVLGLSGNHWCADEGCACRVGWQVTPGGAQKMLCSIAFHSQLSFSKDKCMHSFTTGTSHVRKMMSQAVLKHLKAKTGVLLRVYACVHAQVCVYKCMPVGRCVPLHVCVHIQACVCEHAHTCHLYVTCTLCVYICVCVCMHISVSTEG